MVPWLMLEKGKVGFTNLCFCPQILHAANLLKVWDWSFKQKYILMKDENVVVAFANQKIKLVVSKIEKWFYQSASFFK